MPCYTISVQHPKHIYNKSPFSLYNSNISQTTRKTGFLVFVDGSYYPSAHHGWLQQTITMNFESVVARTHLHLIPLLTGIERCVTTKWCACVTIHVCVRMRYCSARCLVDMLYCSSYGVSKSKIPAMQ